MKKLWLVVLTLFAGSNLSYLYASDVYVVQGDARGPIVGPEIILWSTDAFFFNRGPSEARVKLLSVSNGGLNPSAPTELFVTSQRSASLSTHRLNGSWRPVDSASPLWVLHLDVPETVVVDDALFIGAAPSMLASPFAAPFKYGKIRLPIFRSLFPANEPQIHLATFLGDAANIPSHANVAIYNGGSTTAAARIDVRQQCDDAIVQTATVAVEANSIVQVTGLTAKAGECSADPGAPPSSVYIVVIVDQPSFSFVSNVANNQVPLTSLSITASNN